MFSLSMSACIKEFYDLWPIQVFFVKSLTVIHVPLIMEIQRFSNNNVYLSKDAYKVYIDWLQWLEKATQKGTNQKNGVKNKHFVFFSLINPFIIFTIIHTLYTVTYGVRSMHMKLVSHQM